jgi:hypothetical protein
MSPTAPSVAPLPVSPLSIRTYSTKASSATLTWWRKYARTCLRLYQVPKNLHQRISRATRTHPTKSRSTLRQTLCNLVGELLRSNPTVRTFRPVAGTTNRIPIPTFTRWLFDDSDSDDESVGNVSVNTYRTQAGIDPTYIIHTVSPVEIYTITL